MKGMIGGKLGPYDVLEEVGRGGMATVYRAYQPSVDRDVAIKVIRKSISSDEVAVMRFQREARLVARLEHPHILPVYDFDGGHDPPYIVMRYLDSGTLKDVLKRGDLPLEEVVYLLNQVASALDYAHRQGIIHRDVKPSNIMIDSEGNAFVTDFGIARIAASGDGGITGTGVTVGTPDYMSPEQARGMSDVDHYTDIYSLGVIAYQMLAGQLPYAADSPLGMLMNHINQPVPDITQIKPDLPAEAGSVIGRALAKDPKKRYASAGEFVSALNSALGGRKPSIPLKIQAAAQEAMTERLTGVRSGEEAADNDTSKSTPHEQNKLVTVLYANAAEYAEIVEDKHGPEAARKAMNALWEAVKKSTGERGGAVLERTDRDLLAVWGVDAAHEDDAERAVFAALDIQAILRKQGQDTFLRDLDDEPLPLKIGLNSGLTLLVHDQRSGELSASGATVSLAQRLAEVAYGAILITHSTFRDVQGVFSVASGEPLRGRGRAGPIEVYRVLEAKARAFRIKARGIENVVTRMVGREGELKLLQYAYLDALEEHETQVVTVVSAAGLGKSRLLYEFTKWAEVYPVKYRIFRGRAAFAMNSRPYALLRDLMSFRFELQDSDSPPMVRQKLEEGVAELVGVDPEMAHLIGHLCGFDLSASPYVSGLKDDPEQLNARARQLFLRLFEKLGHIQLVVMMVEDVHYADDASLDLLAELAREHPDLQLVIVMLSRPSLLERRPDWGEELGSHRLITLEPLDRREGRELVAEILQKASDVPRELRDLIVERGEGNPLYIEELIKMLIEDRVIIKETPDHWRVETSRVGGLRVPPTLVGVLQARFDSLLYPEKVALQRAAVIGRVFYDSAIAALDGSDDVWLDDLDAILKRLVERDFIVSREISAFASSSEYIFAQNMLRDLIYETLLESRRQAYHGRAARWIGEVAGDRSAEYTPMIAEHYEQAGQQDKAAECLRKAGKRALAVCAFTDACRLLEHALSLLPDAAHVERLDTSLALADSLVKLAEFPAAQARLEDALHLAQDLGDNAARTEALYQMSQIATHRGDWDAAKSLLAEALPLAREMGACVALAWTLYGLADTYYRTGELEPAQACAEEALALGREMGNGAVERAALNRLATILWVAYGPGSPEFERALHLLEEMHELAQSARDRRMALTALVNLGAMQREIGDHQASLGYMSQALAQAREIGNTIGVIVASLNLAIEYCLDLQPDRARPLTIEALRLARQIGSETWLAAGLVAIGAIRIAAGDQSSGLAALGLARSHPAAGRDELKDVQYVLDGLLGERSKAAITQSGLETGEGLDLDKVVDAFLEQAVA